jgi:hypothetical protein
MRDPFRNIKTFIICVYALGVARQSVMKMPHLVISLTPTPCTERDYYYHFFLYSDDGSRHRGAQTAAVAQAECIGPIIRTADCRQGDESCSALNILPPLFLELSLITRMTLDQERKCATFCAVLMQTNQNLSHSAVYTNHFLIRSKML